MTEDHQESVSRLRSKIEAGSTDFQDFRKLGSLLFKLGQYQECQALLERVRDFSRSNLDKAKTCVDLGWTSFCSENYEQARQLAEDALKYLHAEMDSPEVFASRGAAQNIVVHCEWVHDRETGEWLLETDKAKEAACLALTYLGQVPFDCVHFEEKAAAFHDAATIHSLLANADECLVQAERCLEISHDDWERASCLTIMAEALRGFGRLQEAQAKIEEALGHAKEWKVLLPKLLLEKGLIQRLTNHPIEAQQTFGRALLLIESASPNTLFRHLGAELYANLGAVCYEMGDIRGASEAYRSVLINMPDTNPYYLTGKVWLGRCLESSGDTEGARACFMEALNLRPNHENRLTALEGLARLSYKDREYGKAAKLFEQLLCLLGSTDPRWISVRLWAASCNGGLGNLRVAQDGYEAVITSEKSTEVDTRCASEGLQRLIAPTGYKYH
jgi:tetratricopeptide (TPR) repeat protein